LLSIKSLKKLRIKIKNLPAGRQVKNEKVGRNPDLLFHFHFPAYNYGSISGIITPY